MKKIAVLLTSFNRRDITLECLHSLQLQDGFHKKYELNIFLVDDGSTDGTSDAVNSKFPEVNVIQGTGSLYWNRGMHLAWKTAVEYNEKFDFYLWLNDDVVLYKNALSHLIDCAEQSEDKGIICGVFEEKQNSGVISYGGGNLKGKTYKPNLLHTEMLQSCNIINGNCVLIPEVVYTKVGLIDPIFPHALGDHDYGLRAKKKGIISYTTVKIIGACSKNELPPKWCLPSVPFIKRLKALYSPLGNSHPYYYTIYISRYFGILKAMKNFISIHIRVLFPSLWKQ